MKQSLSDEALLDFSKIYKMSNHDMKKTRHSE